MSFARILLSATILAAACHVGSAMAGTTVFLLKRSNLVNVSDAAGTTQHEVGLVTRNNVTLGEYFLVRRVDTLAAAPFNAAATHLTLLLPSKPSQGNAAPETITIDGAHEFSLGGFKGSVSATSPFYAWIRGGDATYTIAGGSETLVVQWTGSSQLTVP
jgi:hypothetical protein